MHVRLHLLIFAVVLPLMGLPLHADTFSLAPMRLEFGAKADAGETRTLTVNNDSDQAVSVTLSVKDFVRLPDGQERELEPGTAPRGCSTWLTVSPRVINLAPREKGQVRVSILVPASAEGTYWAFIFGEQSSTLPERQAQRELFSLRVLVKPRWCIRIHETVPGTLELAGRIDDMSLSPAAETSPLTVGVTFENTGNSLLRCEGRVEFRNEQGETVHTAPLDGNGLFNVYPGDKRVVTATCPTKLAPGTYLALAIVDYGGEELIAGELQFEEK